MRRQLSRTLEKSIALAKLEQKLVSVRAEVEGLEAQVRELQRQEEDTKGRTDVNEAEIDAAPARKKRRVVKSEQDDVYRQTAKLLRKMKELVKAREQLIEEKRQIKNNLDEACRLLSLIRLHGVRANTGKLTEKGADVEDRSGSSDDSSQYEISEIIDSVRSNRRKPKGLWYRVRWAGFEGTKDEVTWVHTDDMTGASQVVDDFHKCNPDKPGP